MAEENTIDIKNIEALLHVVKDIKVTEPQKCLFDSISDIYYRENFHSDILAYYLSYDCVKEKLIDWINRCFEKNVGESVDFALYKGGSKPKREEGRRDITIYSNDEQHAIIIENKSNGAYDMPDQIPRYYESLKNQNKECKVSAIIYLNKSVCNDPDFCSWTNEQQIINIAAELGVKLSDNDAKEHLDDMRRKLVIATLNGENGFSQNVIDSVLLDCESVRVCGLSLEIKCLFSNIVNGVYGMTDENFNNIMEILKNTEKFNALVTMNRIMPNLSVNLRGYYQSKVKEVFNTGVSGSSKKITVRFQGTTKYYMEIWFDNFWKNELIVTFAILNNELFTEDRASYDELLKKVDDTIKNLGEGSLTDGGLLSYTYKPTSTIFDSVDFIDKMKSVADSMKQLS